MKTVFKKRLKFIILISLIIFTLGCAINDAIEKKLDEARNSFPFDLMIGIDDLSYDYRFNSGDYPKVEGAISYIAIYGRTSKELATSILHQLTIYPDSELAARDFSTWEDKWFTNDWIPIEESRFKPNNLEDLYLLKCLPAGSESWGQSCRFLQLHGNLIILVGTTINEESNLSFAEFDEVLRKLDARLPTENVPMPPYDYDSLDK